MQGVAHLVGQCELAVQSAGVVQQHIGVNRRSSRIGAAAFPLILVHINPAVIKALFEDGTVSLPQRGQCVIDGLLCLLIRNVLIYAG